MSSAGLSDIVKESQSNQEKTFNWFLENRHGRVGQISKETSVNDSSVSRACKTLKKFGVLRQPEEGGEYVFWFHTDLRRDIESNLLPIIAAGATSFNLEFEASRIAPLCGRRPEDPKFREEFFAAYRKGLEWVYDPIEAEKLARTKRES